MCWHRSMTVRLGHSRHNFDIGYKAVKAVLAYLWDSIVWFVLVMLLQRSVTVTSLGDSEELDFPTRDRFPSKRMGNNQFQAGASPRFLRDDGG